MNGLAQYLLASAAAHPQRTAVVDPSGSAVTYEALNDQADRIAAFLVDIGIEPGDRVGVVLPKSAAAVAILYGIMRARAAYVPADLTAPVERTRSILADCGVRAAFLSDTDALPAGARLCGIDEAMTHAPADHGEGSRSDVAYILYTSGSTGTPKGVVLTHENAFSFIEWASDTFRPTEHDRFSAHAPFHFDLSVLDLYLSARHGGTLYLISESVGKSPRELAPFIADSRLTMWYSTPSTLALLAEFGNLASYDCTSLRHVLFAGEVFPVKQLRALTKRWPAPAYWNLYGPTETNVCTFARIPAPVPDERSLPYPIGRPCGHCETRVLDETGKDVTEGDEGLLHVAGPSVFSGYWNRPEQSGAVFLNQGGRRWYNTGDVVRLDRAEGLVYVGRRDRMIKRRGYRIELGEIEHALHRHPALSEAAAVAASGDTGPRIVAFVVTRDNARPSIVDLKAFCARQLPSYMSPDAFVFLPALPRTSTGKIDLRELASLAAT